MVTCDKTENIELWGRKTCCCNLWHLGLAVYLHLSPKQKLFIVPLNMEKHNKGVGLMYLIPHHGMPTGYHSHLKEMSKS